jgi:hypothetical protein
MFSKLAISLVILQSGDVPVVTSAIVSGKYCQYFPHWQSQSWFDLTLSVLHFPVPVGLHKYILNEHLPFVP